MTFAKLWSSDLTSAKATITRQRRRHLVPSLVCICCLSGALFVAAGNAFANNDGSKTKELSDVKSRLQALARDLAKSEEKQGDVADQLRETETSISDATRRLRQLTAERGAVQAELDELEAQSRRLDQQTARQQAQLGKILRAQSTQRDANSLQSLLAARDPNQIARDDYFLFRLSQAKANLIQELKAIATQKRALAVDAAQRKQQIVGIENSERESRANLLALQRKRQTTLASLANKIQAQRRQIGSLKRNEQRLSKLIEGLGRLAAERPTRKPPVGAGDTPIKKPIAPPSRAKLANADPGRIAGAFGALRGKLRAPVEGILRGRFGGVREDGGTTWKGIFIRADEGTEVRAVAAGTVVFSEWMRGFGNLLVIDHDDDFLSVYGNNETLLASTGQQVASGATISTVGATGGVAEAGLYFELRHKGQPFDPLKWIVGKLK